MQELEYQLWCLEDPVVLPEHKLRATARLRAEGKHALGLLIERLSKPGDPIFMEEILVPTGVMNPGAPRTMRVSLKFQIESILYEILYPEQAPRPELRGEPVLTQPKTQRSAVPSPKQTLAEMKADWDNARDFAIGELAPTELGGAIAFVQDWESFWEEHQDKALEELQWWSRQQVQQRWAQSMSSAPTPLSARTSFNQDRENEGPENLEILTKAYEQAWKLFTGATDQPGRKPIAIKALEDIKTRHPYLEPHMNYLLQQLT